MPSTPEWISRKHRACHITLRDIDIPDFDVDLLVERLQRCHIDVATLFAGGYVCVYPSKLDWQRQCSGLNGRDLFGEMLAAATKAGIKLVPCIDIGEVPVELAKAKPALAAANPDGSIMMKSAVTAKSCPLGPFIRQSHAEVLDELVERYDIDCVKWAGASYGGVPVGCHCQGCRQRYPKDTGKELPSSDFAQDPDYMNWRETVFSETVTLLKDSARKRGLIVIGNSVWHLGRNKRDICAIAERENVTQIEIQSRYYHWQQEGKGDFTWDRFSGPIESTRYVSNVSKNPPWVVASYFLAWPWRWSAVPTPEQKIYLAQVAANGGSPMVNFTTGAPHQHYDQRGMEALESLFGFIETHDRVYQDDRSAARIALIYDHASAIRDIETKADRYLRELQGMQDALDRWHLPYDIINSARIGDIDTKRHLVCIVPDATAIPADVAQKLLSLQDQGTAFIWTGGPSSETADGPSPDLLEALGIDKLGPRRPFLELDEPCPAQAYGRILQPDHELFRDIASPVLAMDDAYHVTTARSNAETLLHRMPPFRLFPEGQSYPETDDPAEPLAILRSNSVYFPFTLGYACHSIGHPDHARLLVNALALLSQGQLRPLVQGKRDLRLSLRATAQGELAIHAINTTGRGRFLDEYTPLFDFDLQLPQPYTRVTRLSDGQSLPLKGNPQNPHLTIDRLTDYDVLLCQP